MASRPSRPPADSLIHHRRFYPYNGIYPSHEGQCYSGNVSTYHGIVEVSCWIAAKESVYRFVHKGREYTLIEPRSRTHGGLARAAHRFARKAVGGSRRR